MADDQDQASKTEDPTQRKLTKLREEGNVATSKEVNNLFAVLGMLLLIGLVAPWSFGKLGSMVQSIIANAGNTDLTDRAAIGAVLSHLGVTALIMLLPMIFIMLVLGYLGSVIQNGPLWSGKPIELNWEKVSPMAGFKRLFSLRSLAEFIKALLKLGLIGGAIGMVLWNYRDTLPTLPDAELPAALIFTNQLILYILGATLGIMVFLALLDYIFQKFQYIQQHRMSRQELKDEMRETEGDPYVKQRQRQIRMERARRRMMASVPSADVIITNPTHYSIALRYKPDEDAAPVVLAKGVDNVALRIREVAAEHNIPFYEDPPLARALFAQAEIDQTIPLDLYEATARVIAFIMRLKNPRTAA